MKADHRSIPAARTSKRPGFEFHFDLSFKSRRCAITLLLSVSALVLFALGETVTTMAQTQTSERPAATPTTTPTNASQKPAPSLTGTIKGRLVSGDGQPLTNANVMAQALTSTPTAKPTRVDSEGRFVFDDLPAASYIIIGTAPGYIDQSMSLGDATQWPRHLIGANVRITMIRGGVITGLVTNAKGEPIVGVPVHATLQNAQPSITNFFTGAGVTETDDRGSYRIYGLLPGQYTLHAGGNGQFGQFTPSGFDIEVPTYYPASTRDTAVPVSVRSGDEASGINIKYKGIEGHSISGVVLGNVEAGTLSGAITIFLANAGSTSVLSLEITAVTDPRRAFSFNGIADGEYDLFATYLASQTDSAVVGTKRVTVRGGDVTGVELHLTPLASITGTITLDPIKPENKCDQRGSQLIETIPTAPRDQPKKSESQSMIAMLSGGLGLLSEKGEFALRNLEAARYRLEIKLPTESWYVRAINLPDATARAQQLPTAPPTQPPFGNPNLKAWQGVVTLKSGEKLNGVSIMVGQDAAGLYGRVGPAGAAIREGTRVHLVPVEREQADNVLRYSESLVKSDGSFALTNLAPGRYLILSRVEAPTETEAPRRPSALDALVRAKLRREAETANTMVELKPCQRMVDYELKLTASLP
jgi:carboxypeptidase family protein